MRRMSLAAVVAVLVLGAAAHGDVASAVPTLINYQGQLVDSNSDILPNGEYTLAFSVYDSKESTGLLTWGPQTLSGVKTSNGFFNVNLGPADDAGVAIAAAFMSKPGTWEPGRFLEVTIAGSSDQQVLDRQEILTTPYALRAENEVPAGTIISYAGILDGSHPVPDGWLLCDGSALKSADYPALYAAIEEYWGDGSSDGEPETDFNIPELTDTCYLRGADPTGVLDPDVASRSPQKPGGDPGDVGSTQEHSVAAHDHSLSNHSHTQGDLYAKIAFDSSTSQAYIDFIPYSTVIILPKEDAEEGGGDKIDPFLILWDNWGDNRNLMYRGVVENDSSGTATQGTDVSGNTGTPDDNLTLGTTTAPETGSERTLPSSLEIYFLIRY